MKINCIIIEDEPLAQERAKGYISKLASLNLTGCFDNALDGMAFLKSNVVDVIFLDINMDGLTGIQLLENASISAKVIITTAYDQYALKGYDLNVSDFLLKPYTFERFVKAVNKVESQLETEKGDFSDYVFVKTEHRLEKIVPNEITFIEGMRDYRRIHTETKKIMTLQTFSELESMLSPQLITRVHKSYMVNIKKIETIERNRIKIGIETIPISETYKTSFFNLIKS